MEPWEASLESKVAGLTVVSIFFSLSSRSIIFFFKSTYFLGNPIMVRLLRRLGFIAFLATSILSESSVMSARSNHSSRLEKNLWAGVFPCLNVQRYSRAFDSAAG